MDSVNFGILKSNFKMMQGIQKGVPVLSEMLIDTSIRHAINTATSLYNGMISTINYEDMSDKPLLNYSLNTLGYNLVVFLKESVNNTLDSRSLEEVNRLIKRFNDIEPKARNQILNNEKVEESDKKAVEFIFGEIEIVIDLLKNNI